MTKKIMTMLALLIAWQMVGQQAIPSTEIAKAKSMMKSNHVSENDVSNALKLTLVFGLNDAIKGLKKKNGFYKDSEVHISLPPELQKVVDASIEIKNTLTKELEKQLNRVAEESMGKAKPIFKGQLNQLKFLNAVNVLLGKEAEATQYFEDKASPVIVEKLKPTIDALLTKTGASDQLNGLLQQIKDKSGIGIEVNLTDYVTQQTVDGVFKKIADNEEKMKLGNTLRTTLLLKTVFDLRDKIVR